MSKLRGITSASRTNYAAPDAIALEDRVLYSATPFAVDQEFDEFDSSVDLHTALDEFSDHLSQDHAFSFDDVSESACADMLDSLDSMPYETSLLGPLEFDQDIARELIVIDSSVPDVERLIDDLLHAFAENGSTSAYELLLLEDCTDGLETITQTLRADSQWDAVHILSHGSQAHIELGNTCLSSENLAQEADQLRAWRDFLSNDADILLYGCDVARTEDGREFVESIGELTGADVSASDDLTGHNALGGDWELEYAFGEVESDLALSLDVRATWENVLSTNTLSFSTDGNVTGNATPELTDWRSGEVLELGDPTLSFGENTTDGTLSSALLFDAMGDGDVRINSVDFVNQDLVVGKTSHFELFAGDILFSTADDETIDGVTYRKEDVVLFRPDTAGEYSSGTFSRVLENPTGANITALTLVESATQIGDTFVHAGEMIIADNRSDLLLFTPDDISSATPGAVSTLILGSDIDMDRIIFGVELVEHDTTIGATTLSAGQMLITFDSDDNQLGNNQLTNGEQEDVFVLDVSTTTLGATRDGLGTSSADASFLVDGDGIDLEGVAENIDAIALRVNTPPDAQDDRVGLSFDGDDFVVVSDDASLQMTDNLTMEAWINPQLTGTGTQIILNKEGEYELGITAESGEVIWALDNADPDWSWHNTGYVVQANQWSHVAVTYDSGTVNTYVNGIMVDSYAGSGSIVDAYVGLDELHFGGRQNAATQRFEGRIDEVRVWDVTRTETQIAADMNASLTGGEAGLQGYWQFDEGMGDTAVDLTANNNNGTLGGGVVANNPAWDGYVTDQSTPIDTDLLDNWTYRQKLTLNNVQQAEDLADFPVLVVLDSSRVDYSKTQDAGEDLRFYDADGALLAHEIESWDETGKSYVWVKVSQIDSGSRDDFIWMYYGNGSVADGQNAAGVWTDYRAVYHLNEDPGAGGTVNDSSINSLDGTNSGSLDLLGLIGGSQQFDGTSDYIDLGSDRDIINNATAATAAIWINCDTTAGTGDVLGVSLNAPPTSGSSRIAINRNGDNITLIARTMDDNSDSITVTTSTNPLTTGTWHYVTGTVDYAVDVNNLKIYVDGELQGTFSHDFTNNAIPNTNSTNAAMGSNEGGGGPYFDGHLDEARIAARYRSADWVKAQYLSMTDDNFVIFGVEQTVGGVLENDVDANHDVLLVTEVNGVGASVGTPVAIGSGAILTLHADGSFFYDPNGQFDYLTAGESTTDSFTYTVDDGNGGSDTATVTITIRGLTDAPIESSIEGTNVAYTENDPATQITNTIAVSDVDDTNIENATVHITGNYAAGQDVLAFTNTGTITGVWNSVSGTMTLTGTDTLANYEAALRSVTYENTSEDPSVLTRTISFTVNDGDVDSNLQTRDITIASINDDPTNTASLPTDVSVVEETATNVDLGLINLADVDAGTSNLTVTLSTSVGGVLTANTGGGVTVGGSGTATITLTGNLTNLNTFLDTVTNVQYTGPTDLAGNDVDTIQVGVTDNGNTGTGGGGTISLGIVNVDITNVNEAPVEATIEAAPLAYTENDPATQITNTIAVSDVDDTNIENATIQITGNYAAGQDVLAFTNTGTITGVWNAVSGTMTLTGTDTLANYEAALRSVTYQNTNDDPSALTRTISFTVNDGDNDSNPQTRDVTVILINDDPTNSGSLPTDVTVVEETATNVDLGLINLADVDAGTSNLTVTISTSAGGVLTANTGGGVTVGGSGTAMITLTGAMTDLNTFLDTVTNVQYTGPTDLVGNDVDTIHVDVTDNGNTGTGGGGTIALGTVNVDITNVNDAPVITSDGGGATASINVAENTISVTTVTATDVDLPGDTLTYSITGGADSADFAINSSSGALTLITGMDFESPTDANTDGIYEVLVTVDDGNGGSDAQMIGVNITDTNDAPVAVGDSYSLNEGATLNIMPGGVLANDMDADGDPLTATLISGPAHGTLALNADGSLTYAHDGGETTSDSFTYQSDDGKGGVSSTVVGLTINPVNDAPISTNDFFYGTQIDGIDERSGGVLSNDFDVEGDAMTAMIVGGPVAGAISFNPDGTFFYRPAIGFAGTDSFQYVVTDGMNVSAAATVTLDIDWIAPPPGHSGGASDDMHNPPTIPLPPMEMEIVTIPTMPSTADRPDEEEVVSHRIETSQRVAFEHELLDAGSPTLVTANVHFPSHVFETLVRPNGTDSEFNLSRLWDELAAIDYGDEAAQQFHTFTVGAVTTVAGAATALYISWLVQGSSLLTGVLSTIPSWQFLDPLPVLGAGAMESARRKRGDDSKNERVEKMFDESTQCLA